MSTIKITAPNHEFNGVVATVPFVDGKAEVESDNRAALEYFSRHGYGISSSVKPPKGEDEALTIQKAGSAPEPFTEWDEAKLKAYADQHQIRYPKDADKGTLVGLLEGRDAANGNETPEGNQQTGAVQTA